jgi:hypothetical protein
MTSQAMQYVTCPTANKILFFYFCHFKGTPFTQNDVTILISVHSVLIISCSASDMNPIWLSSWRYIFSLLTRFPFFHFYNGLWDFWFYHRSPNSASHLFWNFNVYTFSSFLSFPHFPSLCLLISLVTFSFLPLFCFIFPVIYILQILRIRSSMHFPLRIVNF